MIDKVESLTFNNSQIISQEKVKDLPIVGDHASSKYNPGSSRVKSRKNNSISPNRLKPISLFHARKKSSIVLDSTETSQQYLAVEESDTPSRFDSIVVHKKETPTILKGRRSRVHYVSNTPVRLSSRVSFVNEEGEIDYGEDTASQIHNKTISYFGTLNRRKSQNDLDDTYSKQNQDNIVLKNSFSTCVQDESQNYTALTPLKPRSKEIKQSIKRPQICKLQKLNVKGIEQLILLKKSNGHQLRMQEYKRRRGLDEDIMIFCFNSRDWHIKQALERFGWVENPSIDSQLFDLKWTYRDLETDYQKLNEGQYYNHFRNNQELTTKSGLMKNLIENAEFGMNRLNFFPRGYDLSQVHQLNEFKEDFEKTALGNLLKNLWKYLKIKVSAKSLKKIKEKFWLKEIRKRESDKIKQKRNLYEEYRKTGQSNRYRKYVVEPEILESYRSNNHHTDQEKSTKKKWWEKFHAEEQRGDFKIDMNLVIKALRCFRTLIKCQKSKLIEDEDYFGIEELVPKIKQALIWYSKCDYCYDEIPEEDQVTFLFLSFLT